VKEGHGDANQSTSNQENRLRHPPSIGGIDSRTAAHS
jgi:hypothetical protein